jgi:hypothetical protein
MEKRRVIEVFQEISDVDELLDPRNDFTMPASLDLAPDMDPAAIAARLVQECDEFKELRDGEPLIMFVFRNIEKVKADRVILGELTLPRFMGGLASFSNWLLALACQGSMPDFIMTLDHNWWNEASALQREALVHHELCHAKHGTDKEGELKFNDDGDPVWAITGHSIEEFDATVERYGAWEAGIQSFVSAARRGGVI